MPENWFFLLPFLAMLNHVRGGGLDRVTQYLPGRPMYYAALMVGMCAHLVYGPACGLMVVIGFWIWAAPGWGLWFDLHRYDHGQVNDKRWRDPFVRFVWAIGLKNDHLSLWWRHFLLILPLVAAVSALSQVWWGLVIAPIFAALTVLSYEVGWRLKKDPIMTGEILTGIVWWGLIAGLAPLIDQVDWYGLWFSVVITPLELVV